MIETRYAENTYTGKAGLQLSGFSYPETQDVRRLHRMIPGYSQTALVSLSGLAEKIGVRAIFVKDESARFGLKAFKGLGGIYAMYRIICRELGLDPETVTFSTLLEEPWQEKIRDMTFATTTDGNHGKGVSWAAGVFGCKAYVYMPKGTVPVRARAVRDAGNAEVTITDMLYDDCVIDTKNRAERNGWFLIQDTAWPGYEQIPTWIMQGYTTLYYEALDQMKTYGYERPTHIFLQAGVGSMAGAIAAAACTVPGDNPKIMTVEPDEVACFYESYLANDGKPHKASGNSKTIMAGLNCAVPCSIAWDLLKETAVGGFACPDEVTEKGMRRLALPIGSDTPIVSGESGAVSAGLLETLMSDKDYLGLREQLKLGSDSVVFLISTEGDTDPDNYRKVLGAI